MARSKTFHPYQARRCSGRWWPVCGSWTPPLRVLGHPPSGSDGPAPADPACMSRRGPEWEERHILPLTRFNHSVRLPAAKRAERPLKWGQKSLRFFAEGYRWADLHRITGSFYPSWPCFFGLSPSKSTRLTSPSTGPGRKGRGSSAGGITHYPSGKPTPSIPSSNAIHDSRTHLMRTGYLRTT